MEVENLFTPFELSQMWSEVTGVTTLVHEAFPAFERTRATPLLVFPTEYAAPSPSRKRKADLTRDEAARAVAQEILSAFLGQSPDWSDLCQTNVAYAPLSLRNADGTTFLPPPPPPPPASVLVPDCAAASPVLQEPAHELDLSAHEELVCDDDLLASLCRAPLDAIEEPVFDPAPEIKQQIVESAPPVISLKPVRKCASNAARCKSVPAFLKCMPCDSNALVDLRDPWTVHASMVKISRAGTRSTSINAGRLAAHIIPLYNQIFPATKEFMLRARTEFIMHVTQTLAYKEAKAYVRAKSQRDRVLMPRRVLDAKAEGAVIPAHELLEDDDLVFRANFVSDGHLTFWRIVRAPVLQLAINPESLPEAVLTALFRCETDLFTCVLRNVVSRETLSGVVDAYGRIWLPRLFPADLGGAREMEFFHCNDKVRQLPELVIGEVVFTPAPVDPQGDARYLRASRKKQVRERAKAHRTA